MLHFLFLENIPAGYNIALHILAIYSEPVTPMSGKYSIYLQVFTSQITRHDIMSFFLKLLPKLTILGTLLQNIPLLVEKALLEKSFQKCMLIQAPIR